METPLDLGNRNRKTASMAISPKDRRWVGFDLGGSKMLAVVYDDDFKAVARERKKIRAGDGVGDGVDRIVSAVEEALKDADTSRANVAGIGIGCPGPIDLDRGVLVDAPNLGWEDAPLRKKLTDAFDCPVSVINDADAGLYGEHRFGAARKARCVIGVFPGTGIGGSCVYEGRILRGKVHSCFEIGHSQVLPGGPICGCGQRGCLEAVASRLAISAAAAAAAYRGQAPHLLKAAGTNLADVRSGMLADAIKNGDKVVEKIVRDAARWIGIAVANTVNLLAPDTVLLGGGLVEAMPDLFRDVVAETANDRVMRVFRNSFKVVVAELGDDAIAAGAAAWACEMAAASEKT